MNGDDHLDPHDLNTPVEILTAGTLGWIETLRRKRVCFYPGPRHPVRPGDITDFAQCLPCLGDCNALIFCAPHHGRETARAEIQHYVGGGDPALEINSDECVGLHSGLIWDDRLLFPRRADNLLVVRSEPNAEPIPTRPPDEQFWAHYVVLSFVGRADKLHLLHLGLRGDHAWPYFLTPHGIQVARTITGP